MTIAAVADRAGIFAWLAVRAAGDHRAAWFADSGRDAHGMDRSNLLFEMMRAEERRRSYERSRWEMMRGYAERESCRRQYLLNYFGEEYEPGSCARCDNDGVTGGIVSPKIDREVVPPGPLAVGDQVVHASFGSGVVQRVTVLFDQGYKTLAAELVLAEGLLTPALTR